VVKVGVMMLARGARRNQWATSRRSTFARRCSGSIHRTRHERHRRRAAEQRDDRSPLHSITSSARASTDGGTARPMARAFRWRDMLESGEYATIREIAAAEKINESYVGRVLRLTLLAPGIVEAILGGRQPAGLQLDGLMRRFPVEWLLQRRALSR
jgi:hypothetical protein